MSIFETSSELFDDTSVSSFESSSSVSTNSHSYSSESIVISIRHNSTNSQYSSGSSENMDNTSSESDTSISSVDAQHMRRLRQTARYRGSPTPPSSQNESDDMLQTDSNHSTDSTASDLNQESLLSGSSDTEAYDVEAELQRANEGVIEINESQMPDIGNNSSVRDDDVILIPQQIETIDLCTQALPVPFGLRNEIIDITDSPGTQPSNIGPIRNRRNRRNAVQEFLNNSNEQLQPSPARPSNQLNFNDSFDSTQPKIALSCPICMDTLVNRYPVSTLCGHLFCKTCITQALQNAKKCPMCKKALGGRKPFLDIFLPC